MTLAAKNMTRDWAGCNVLICHSAGVGNADDGNVTKSDAYRLFARCKPRAISKPPVFSVSQPINRPIPIYDGMVNQAPY